MLWIWQLSHLGDSKARLFSLGSKTRLAMSHFLLVLTVTGLYQDPAGHTCPGSEGCSSDPSSSPAACWLPLDILEVLQIAVLPFIIEEMAVDCVGEGSIP